MGGEPQEVARRDVEDAVPVVAVGASAGGLSALERFFSRVPKETGLAFVVVVHLSPDHESHLEEVVQSYTPLPVRRVSGAVAIERDHVYVIPPNANLEAIDSHLRLTELETARGERRPIDHFFRTLADTHDGQGVGVVLSGTGSDGTIGLAYIRERGGLTVAQQPSDAAFDGMPRSAIAAGQVDLVLPAADIPEAVLRYVSTDCSAGLGAPEDEGEESLEARSFLQKVFAVVRRRTGRDLRCYKRSTILRRIARRMQFGAVQQPAAYLELLRTKPDEVTALADDLLINVTQFFRDPEVFDSLEPLLRSLVGTKGADEPVRLWSVGCASGEEAYSLAMLLVEQVAGRESPPAVQVFASDLHKKSIDRAREGLYPVGIEAHVRPDRLLRFFQREEAGYRIKPEVRDLVVFALHNVLAQPPFSRLDLISCRNLFIYLARELHRQVLELFHYALRPSGYLVLGPAERVEDTGLFTVVSKKHGIYRRRDSEMIVPRLPVFTNGRASMPELSPASTGRPEVTSMGAIHQRVVERYAPPSVLLGPDDTVVHFSSRAGRYFVQPGGVPTAGVFKLIREELSLQLKAAVSAARSGRVPLRTSPATITFDGVESTVSVDVHPALEPGQEGFVLLIFDERPVPELDDAAESERRKRPVDLVPPQALAEQRLRELLRDHEANQEELRASNEELQSVNEELRSTLEELETSKEELQSINEELQILNQENRHKVEELAHLSSDLQNLFAATDMATLFLDRELNILRFTPKTTELFSVQPSDRGRPLSDLTHRLGREGPGLLDDARLVLAQLVPLAREVRDTTGRWHLMRVLPYRDLDDRIAGVVVTFVDISLLKEAQEALRSEKEYSELIIETLPEPLLVLTAALTVHAANPAFYAQFALTEAETRGQLIFSLQGGRWDIPTLRGLLEGVASGASVFSRQQVEQDFGAIGRRVLLISGRRLERTQLVLLGISDITERHQAEVALAAANQRLLDADRRKNDFLAMLSHELRNPLLPIRNSLYVIERAPPDSDLGRRALAVIDRQIGHMTRLIEDLLDVTRITRGQVQLQREAVELNALARRVVDDHRGTFADAGVALEVTREPGQVWVDADQTRLVQAVGNLLQNAMKFTPRGGETVVTVEADAARRTAMIQVRDTGRGIAPALLPHLFEPFTQGEVTIDRRKGGLGLGLALVKGLVEMHGGAVSATSDGPGAGATFTILLPLLGEGDPREARTR